MSWNYRVVKLSKKDGDDNIYQIAEVYYDDTTGKINAYSLEPPIPYGNNINEIKQIIKHMEQAINKEILNEEDLINWYMEEKK